jgi:protein O-GlcNAc transferase
LVEGWLGSGGVLATLRGHQDALASHDKSLELKPDFDQAWVSHRDVFPATGRSDLALAAAQRALRKRPEKNSVCAN